MTRGRVRMGVLLGAAVLLAAACGSGNEDRPPPTIGDATVVERPAPDVATTTEAAP